jgi:hypothetical protein
MTVARQARLWQWGAVVYGLCAVAFITFFPSVTVGDQEVPMIWVWGPWMLVPVSIPVIVAAVPALVPGRKALVAWIVAGVLGVFVVATLFSIGLLFLPVAAFTATAAYLHQRAPIEDAPPVPDTWDGKIPPREGGS